VELPADLAAVVAALTEEPLPVAARDLAEAAALMGWLPDPAYPYLPLVTIAAARAVADSTSLRAPAG